MFKVTHKGLLLDVIGQFHTDVASESSDEVSSAIVAEAVARAAGTRDNLVSGEGGVGCRLCALTHREQTNAAPSQNKRVEAQRAAPAPNAASAPAPAKKYAPQSASLVSQPKKVGPASVGLSFEL